MLQKSCLRVVGYLLIAGAASLSPQMLLGQTTQLRGRVLDQSNAVIPGVALALTNQATQISHTAWSDEEGRYQFLELPPGNFTLLTEHPGFKVNIVRDIRLEVNFPAAMDVLLEVGTVQETITVEGLHDSVNRVDGSLGNTMTPEQIQGIPLNARNLAAALSLQPGVTPDGEVTGSRSDQLTLTLDGINVNDQFLQVTDSGTPFQPILRVTPDSIQEFRVVTSNPGARLGRSSGAQVSLITRSGTNDFHGSLYLYHRNKVTAANRFFNNRVEGDPDQDGEPGIGRPNLIRNVFGGSVGGPVVQNRAFFFFNYERRTDRSETSVAQPVPLAHLGEGKMRYLGREGQPIELGPDDMATLYPATGGVNEAVTRVFADAARRYPANEPGTVDFNWGIYRFNRATPLDWNSYTAKLDFNITQTLRLFLRGNYQWDHSDRGGKWPDSTVSPKTWSHPMGLSAGQTWTIRPTLINDFRYGLTRQAATWFGDTSQNWINIGFSPWSQLGDISSCVPVQNFTNDTSWVLGSHTLQFGANIRLISASDVDSRQSYDGGNTEYIWAGGWDAPIIDTELMYGPGQQFVYREAAAALLGRFTHYWNNYNFDVDGTLLPQGQENRRTYATQEYEFYFADSWQLSPKLTLNLGLRWGVNTPVSETTGYQVQPTVSLDDYFERRKASAQQGVPLNELLTIDRSGPYYDRPGYYSTDWNNLAPRISFAYSPSFDSGALQKIFGSTGQSVIRGGFAVMYDRIGTRLAWSFDKDNALGFHSAASIPTQTYHVMHNPGPSFTGWGQDIRGFPSLPPPEEISFPLTQFPDGSNNLGSSLDDAITSPVNYNWNLSIGRELPGGMFLEVAYVGRIARNLLASRDILQPNNIVDPSSGMDWYTAAAALSEYRENNVPISQVPEIPFFENLFPDLPATWWWSWDPSLSSTQNVFAFVSRDGFNLPDWTFLQAALDDAGPLPNLFFQPQYGSLTTKSTVASSHYNALTVTLRQRFKQSLSFDLNYTWSKSIDNASAREDAGGSSDAGFILNALLPDDMHSVSSFDIQHIINSNWLWQLPFGKGRTWLNDLPPVSDTLLGGWSLNGIFRWNSGLPQRSPYDASYWATNWAVQSWAIRLRDPKPSPTKSGAHPNYWSDPQYAYNSYRNARAGETGDRNVLRRTGFVQLDLGLHKRFRMPFNEDHSVTFAWEAFNVTNTQRLGGAPFWVNEDPQIAEVPPNHGNIYTTQGIPREMQFSLRYDF